MQIRLDVRRCPLCQIQSYCFHVGFFLTLSQLYLSLHGGVEGALTNLVIFAKMLFGLVKYT